jgi:hypothetical protein
LLGLFIKFAIMRRPLKYIIDDSGNKTSVLVPVKVWDDLNTNFQKLQAKLAILSGIHDGLDEVKRSRKSGKKLQTLKDFLK